MWKSYNFKGANVLYKVGILSMQRVVNHGSFLQAYGLKKLIEKSGVNCQCDFIDLPEIRPQNRRKYICPSFFDRIKYIIHRLLGHDAHCKDLYAAWHPSFRFKVHKKSLKKYLGLTDVRNYKTDYSTVVIGSDEIFNCTQYHTTWADTMMLFGQGIDSDNIISYAGSFGYTTIDQLKEYGLIQKITENLKNFKAISVRDENSAKIIEILSNKKPLTHLDPVLVYDYNNEISKRRIKKKYILVYQYHGRIQEKTFIEKIKEIAKRDKCRIISISGYCDWADKNIITNSFEVMRFFRDAEYVVTDTFHGCIMSIKFHKKFVTFCRESNENKLYNLLSKFSLQTQIADSDCDPDSIFNNYINWAYVDSIISNERKRTIQYLKDNIFNR